MLDKILKHARGEMREDYHEMLSKGFDGRTCAYLRVNYEELKARVLQGGSDEKVLSCCQQHSGRKLTEIDVFAWNGFAAKRGWRDESTSHLEKYKSASGLAHRTDLVTFFDYYEVDEDRAPRDV